MRPVGILTYARFEQFSPHGRTGSKNFSLRFGNCLLRHMEESVDIFQALLSPCSTYKMK